MFDKFRKLLDLRFVTPDSRNDILPGFLVKFSMFIYSLAYEG